MLVLKSKKAFLLVIILVAMMVLSSIASESQEPPREEFIVETAIDVEENESEGRVRRLAGTPARLTQSDRDALLNKHNHYRSLTTQGLTGNQPGSDYMEQLEWDSTLEEMAMAQAKTCEFRARGDLRTEYATKNGQNGNGPVRQSLYQITGMRAGSQDYILRAVTSWYNKHSLYNYYTGQCSGRYCGLYLNIVWASTRFVGCGYNVCNGATIVICNYLSGRTSGEPYPHWTGDGPCSLCPAGRKTCSNSLCTGASMGTPTRAPVAQPTRQPTQTFPPTKAGQVAACKGYQVSLSLAMKFGPSTSGVTCQDYKDAFTSLFPCVQIYTRCSVRDYPDFQGWANVTLGLQSSNSVWRDIRYKLYSNQVKWGMKSYLEGKGFKWGTR